MASAPPFHAGNLTSFTVQSINSFCNLLSFQERPSYFWNKQPDSKDGTRNQTESKKYSNMQLNLIDFNCLHSFYLFFVARKFNFLFLFFYGLCFSSIFLLEVLFYSCWAVSSLFSPSFGASLNVKNKSITKIQNHSESLHFTNVQAIGVTKVLTCI